MREGGLCWGGGRSRGWSWGHLPTLVHLTLGQTQRDGVSLHLTKTLGSLAADLSQHAIFHPKSTQRFLWFRIYSMVSLPYNIEESLPVFQCRLKSHLFTITASWLLPHPHSYHKAHTILFLPSTVTPCTVFDTPAIPQGTFSSETHLLWPAVFSFSC